MLPETLEMIIDGSHHKGDVFATARIAGIQAAKRTWDLIPLCHPLMLSKVEVNADGGAGTQPRAYRIVMPPDRENWRRDGSPNGRFRGGTDHLRHVQSGAERYRSLTVATAEQKRRKIRRF